MVTIAHEVTLLLILQGLWSNAHTQCQSSRRSSIDFSSTCCSHTHVTGQWQSRVRGDPGYGEEEGAKARGSTPRGQWQAPVITYKPWCSTTRSCPDKIQHHSVFCIWHCDSGQGTKSQGSTPRRQSWTSVIKEWWHSATRSCPDRIQHHSVSCVWNCDSGPGTKSRGSTTRGQSWTSVIKEPWRSTTRSCPDRIQYHSVFCVWHCNLTCPGNTNLPMHLKIISVIYSYLTSIRTCVPQPKVRASQLIPPQLMPHPDVRPSQRPRGPHTTSTSMPSTNHRCIALGNENNRVLLKTQQDNAKIPQEMSGWSEWVEWVGGVSGWSEWVEWVVYIESNTTIIVL